jgi:SAM-dependent methyltransferase
MKGGTNGAQSGDSALAAYQALAPAYDAFTSHSDYELWLSKVLPELERHGLKSPGRLLDVGCGSGSSFLPMLERDWSVTACDISPAMIELAGAKVGQGVDLSVADMRELPVLGEFDLVWAIDDAVNYLLGDGDLSRALARMGANLAPAGLIVFDVNTLATYRSFFAAREVSERGGREVVWNGLAASNVQAGSICEARVEGEGIQAHVHRQRHYPEAEVRVAIAETGLRCLDVFSYDDQVNVERPPDELRDGKITFLVTV